MGEALNLSSVAAEEPVRSRLVTPLRERPIACFDSVWRYWGRGSKRWAVLRGVDLEIAPGTATCIEGRNGAGKTTLLRIATGLLAPDGGRVTIDGISIEDGWRDYHTKIGFLSAGDRGLYARLSVRAHLEYWVNLAFVPRKERSEAVDEAIARFALDELAGRRADRLSQGQRQRLRLALTFVHRPRVVLLDEPRNSLDTDGLELLAAAIDAVLARGGAVIWCSPAGEQQPLAHDHRFVIEDGKLTPT